MQSERRRERGSGGGREGEKGEVEERGIQGGRERDGGEQIKHKWYGGG